MSSACHGPFAQSGIESAELVIGLGWHRSNLYCHETNSLFANECEGMDGDSAQCRAGIESGAILPDRPAHSGHLVGQGHGGLVVTDPSFGSDGPSLHSIQWLAGSIDGLGSGQHRPGTMNDQHSKVFVTPLADPAQPSSVTAGALQGSNPQPGREVPSGLEVMRRASTGHQGSAGQQSNTWKLTDQCDIFVVAGQRSDLLLGHFHLALEIVDLVNEFGEDHPEGGWEVLLVEDSQRMTLGSRRSGRDGVTELPQATAQTID